MKPLGLTSTYRLVIHSAVEDAIYNAVESAIDAGMTPREFVAEATDSWAYVLDEAKRSSRRQFDKLLEHIK